MRMIKPMGWMLAGILWTGCASKQEQAKRIYERPWIGGAFEKAPAPKIARDQHFPKTSVLIIDAPKDTPLEQAGLRAGDLALAVNGRKIKSDQALHQAVKKAPGGPLTFTIYRDGEISEKQVVPGTERYQTMRFLAIGLGLSTRFDVDIFPNPDFSLIALGFKNEQKRLELKSAKGKYLSAHRPTAELPDGSGGWDGITSEEGWRAWLGPISIAKQKVIVSQEPAAK